MLLWLTFIWGVLPWIYPVLDCLDFLDLGGYFLPHVRDVFNYYLLKYFLISFLFVVFFWDTYDSNVEVFNIVPEVSEVVFISFYYFFPSLLHLFRALYHFTYPFFCLSYSTVGSLQSVFDLSYCIVHYWSTLLYLL